MPVVKQYFRMLQKPILYTGLTRAKQSLVLLGDPQAFDIGLKTNGQVRMTQLYDLLEAYFGHETQNSNDDNIIAKHKKVTLSAATIYQIDPMINMNQMTPYDFIER